MSDKRLYKLQIMLSDSELKEIDDFRFETRSNSRSAAVRELINESLTNRRAARPEPNTEAGDA